MNLNIPRHRVPHLHPNQPPHSAGTVAFETTVSLAATPCQLCPLPGDTPRGNASHLPQLREVVESLPQPQHLPAGHEGFFWAFEYLLQLHLGEHQAMEKESQSAGPGFPPRLGLRGNPTCSPPQPTEGTASDMPIRLSLHASVSSLLHSQTMRYHSAFASVCPVDPTICP